MNGLALSVCFFFDRWLCSLLTYFNHILRHATQWHAHLLCLAMKMKIACSLATVIGQQYLQKAKCSKLEVIWLLPRV